MAENTPNILLEEEEVDELVEVNEIEPIDELVEVTPVSEEDPDTDDDKKKKPTTSISVEAATKFGDKFDLRTVQYTELKKKENKEFQKKEKKRKSSKKYKIDQDNFVSYLVDNYFMEEEDGTRPALFEAIGMDNIISIVQEGKMPDLSKTIKDNLLDNDFLEKNGGKLNDQDIDHLIEAVFNEQYTDAGKSKHLPFQRNTYLKIRDGGDPEALSRWMISTENADINALDPNQRAVATLNKQIEEYKRHNDIDDDEDGVIDENEMTPELRDMETRLEAAVEVMDKDSFGKPNSSSVYTKGYRTFFDTKTGNNKYIEEANVEEFLQSDESNGTLDVTLDMMIAQMEAIAEAELTDKDKIRMAYGDYMFTREGYNDKIGERKDFYTDNEGIINLLRNAGHEIVYSGFGDAEYSKLDNLGFSKPALVKGVSLKEMMQYSGKLATSGENPGDSSWIIRNILAGGGENLMVPADFMIEYHDDETGEIKTRELRSANEYHDYLERLHTQQLELALRGETLKNVHLLGIDPTNFTQNLGTNIERIFETGFESLFGKREIEKDFGFSTRDVKDDFDSLVYEYGIDLSKGQKKNLKRTFSETFSESIGGATSILIGLNILTKIQRGVLGVSKFGKWYNNLSQGTYVSKNGKNTFTYSQMVKKANASKKYSKYGDNALDAYVRGNGYKPIASSGMSKFKHFIITSAMEGTKFAMLPGGDFTTGAAFMAGSSIIPNFKFTKYNQFRTLTNLIFNKGPAFAIGHEFSELVGAVHGDITNRKEWKTFINEHYPDYKTVGDRVLLNLMMGKFFGATHLKSIDYKSTAGIKKAKDLASANYFKTIQEKGFDAPPSSEGNVFDAVSGRYFKIKDYNKLKNHQDLYLASSRRLQQISGFDKALNPLTADEYWNNSFEAAKKTFPELKIKIDYNPDNYMLRKDKMNIVYNKDGTPRVIKINPRNVPDTGISNHEIFHLFEKQYIKENPKAEFKHVNLLQGALKDVKIGDENLNNLINREQSITKDIKLSEQYAYLVEYLSKPGIYAELVAGNAFVNLAHEVKSRAYENGWMMPKIENKGDLIQVLGSFITTVEGGRNPQKYMDIFMKSKHAKELITENIFTGESKILSDNYGKGGKLKIDASTTLEESKVLSETSTDFYRNKVINLETSEERYKAFEKHYVTEGNADRMLTVIARDYGYSHIVESSKNVYEGGKLKSGPLKDLLLDLNYDLLNPGGSRGLLAVAEAYHKHPDFIEKYKEDGVEKQRFAMFDKGGDKKINEASIVQLETKYNAKRNTEEFQKAAIADGYKAKQALNKTIIHHMRKRIHEIVKRGRIGEAETVYFDDVFPESGEGQDYLMFGLGEYVPTPSYEFKLPKKDKVVDTKIDFGTKLELTSNTPEANVVIADVNPRIKNWLKETNKKNPDEVSYNNLASEISKSIELDAYVKNFLNIKGSTAKETYNNLIENFEKYEKWLYEALPNTMDLATGENTQIAKAFPFYKQSLGKLNKSETTTGITSGPQIRAKDPYKKGMLIDLINSKRDFGDKVKVATNVVTRVKEMFGNQYARKILNNKGFQTLLKKQAPKGVWENMVVEDYVDNLKTQLRGPVPHTVASTNIEVNQKLTTLNRFALEFKSIDFAKEKDTRKSVNDLIDSRRDYQLFFDKYKRRDKLLNSLFDKPTGTALIKMQKTADAARNLGQLVFDVITPKTFKNWKDKNFKLQVDQIFKGVEGIDIAGKDPWYKNKNKEVDEFDAFMEDFANFVPKAMSELPSYRKTWGDGVGAQLLKGVYRGKKYFDNFLTTIKGNGEELPVFEPLKKGSKRPEDQVTWDDVSIENNKTYKERIDKLLLLPEFKKIGHKKVQEKLWKAVLYGHGRFKGMLPYKMVNGKKVFSSYEQMVSANEQYFEYKWSKLYDFYEQTPGAAKPKVFNNMWRLLQMQTNIGEGIFRGLATHNAISLKRGKMIDGIRFHSEHEFQLLNMTSNGLLNMVQNSGSKANFLKNLRPLIRVYKQSIINKEIQKKYDDPKHKGKTGLPDLWTTDVSKYGWMRTWKLAETTLDLRTGKTFASRLEDIFGAGEALKTIEQNKIRLLNKVNKGKIFNIDLNQYSKVEQLEILNAKDNALAAVRRIDAPEKGMTASDFDYVSGLTKEKVTYTLKDGTKGELNGIQFAERYSELKEKGAEFDYTEFNDVINAKKGPFFNVIEKLKDKHGTDDIYIVTARPNAAAQGIQRFFNEFGVDIRLENIITLEDGRPMAKGKFILEKIGEGYNDILFADDIKANVDVVNNILQATGIKGESRHIVASTNLNTEFNDLIEATTGVASHKRYSKAKAEVAGKNRSQYKFWIPPSAEDFVGLLYPTLAKGKVGDNQMAWYKKNVLDPYARGENAISNEKIRLITDYSQLKTNLKKLDGKGVKGLKENILEKDGIKSPFTKEHAVRVYNWVNQGLEIPGLSKADQNLLIKTVEGNENLKLFADGLMMVNKGEYAKPDQNWVVGTISTDIIRGLQTTGRSKHLKEFIDNSNVIFSEENLNKLQSQYGVAHRNALENILERMKTGNNRKIFSGAVGEMEGKVLDWVNNSVGSIMFLNSRSATLQLLSSVNYINLHDNNILAAGKALANTPQYWKDFTSLYNSNYLEGRRKGNKLNIAESEIAEAVEKGGGGIEGAINYMLNKGFIMTKAADSFAIAFGGAAFYRNRVNTYKKQVNSETGKKYTEAEAEKRAFIDFREISEISQQSARADKISMQQASNLGRIVLAFANTPLQYARLQKRAIQDLYNGRGDAKTNLSKITYYGFVQNVMFNALQQAWFAIALDEDPDDQKQAMAKSGRLINGMLDSQLRGFGYGGAAVATIKNMAFKAYEESNKDMPKYENAAWEMLDFSPPISSKITKARGAFRSIDYDLDDMKEKGFALDNPAWSVGANLTEAATNIPLARLIRKFENIKNASDEETAMWMRLALLSGWSKWELEPDDYEVDPWSTDVRWNESEKRRESSDRSERYLPGKKRRE